MDTQLLTCMLSALRWEVLTKAELLQVLERATGVKRRSFMRFVRGVQTSRLDAADTLAEHFGIGVRRNY